EAPADVVMQDPPARSQAPQDEKSLCVSKALYEPINREAIEELAETRESAAAQALFDRPGRLYTGHHNNLYKGLVQELKKLEMQDQDNSDAIDKLLERIGMFPNLPTVFDGLDKLALTHTEARTVWRNTFVAHKYCGRYIVKLRPSGSFVGPAESEP
ncbi:unnamed protein product, partial [Effrenium voratum]